MKSVFTELLIPNKKNHLTGVIYKHPTTMKPHPFNNDFINTLLNKLTIEKKPSVISGEFNLNLMNYI